jgi:excisionase family DNA binding protein
MRDAEFAASLAISLAKKRGRDELGPDELLLGCLLAIAQFGIAEVKPWTFDLEELAVDWLAQPDRTGPKVAYSQRAVDLFDLASRIARSDGADSIRVDHLLVAFAGETEGLMGQWKRDRGITSAGWRAAIAQLWAPSADRGIAGRAGESGVPATATVRDYLTPEEAAEALSIHVQTLRAYVRSGKLPALRLAGERAIRIRRNDLETVLEPLVPQG